MFKNNNNVSIRQTQSSPGVLVSAEIDEILHKTIFGSSYHLQKMEDRDETPFIGFLLHVDERNAYVEVGASKLLRPTIVLMDRRSLESIPHKIERQKVNVTFEGQNPIVKIVVRTALAA